MNRIPQSFIDQMLSRINIVELIQGRLELKRAGRDYKARCPFHQEKSPSFTVSEQKQFFHCFGCGANGNAIGFLMQYDSLNYIEAVESLAERLGMEKPKPLLSSNKTTQYSADDPYDLLDKSCTFFQNQLAAHPEAIAYLKARGLTQETLSTFRIGYAPTGWDHLLRHLATSESKKRLLKSLDLLSQSAKGRMFDRFRNRIMFPVIDRRARVVGFGARAIDETDQPKYLNSSETPIFEKGKELFGLYHCKEKDRQLDYLLVTEGYMDVVTLFQSGFYRAVAAMGTALTDQQIKLLFRQTKKVILCFDGDSAGRLAAERMLNKILPYLEDSWELRFLLMPEGEDPDSFTKKNGLNAFQEQVKNSLGLSDFLRHQLTNQGGNPNDLNTKPKQIQMAREYLNLCADNAWRIALNESFSEHLNIDKSYLDKQLTPTKNRTIYKRPKLGVLNQEEKLIALLLSYPNIVTHLKPESIALAQAQSPLINQLLQITVNNPHLSAAVLLNYWSDTGDYDKMERCALWNNPLSQPASVNEVRQIITSWRELQQKKQWQQLHEKIQIQGENALNEQEKKNYLSLPWLKSKNPNNPKSS